MHFLLMGNKMTLLLSPGHSHTPLNFVSLLNKQSTFTWAFHAQELEIFVQHFATELQYHSLSLLATSLNRCILCSCAFCSEKSKYCISVNSLIEELPLRMLTAVSAIYKITDHSCKPIG